MADRQDKMLGMVLGAVAVAIVVGLLLAAGILRLGDEGVEPDETGQTSTPIVRPPPVPALPVSIPPLGRADLLEAFARAADAASAGSQATAENAALVGRDFAVRLPFGCGGPMREDDDISWADWAYNAKTGALKLTARPEHWDEEPWIRALAGDLAFDAAEGFWIKRPWSSAETCPVVSTDDTAGPPPVETAALVQFFAPDSPRTLRRGGRPYAYTVKAREPIGEGPRDYGLMVSGRVASFADGQPVHCRVENVDRPPVCLMAVTFERVAFNDVDGRMLTEWRR